ncbi:retrovirus-related Pol polyprotein from transposon 297 [Trichonephila clavipes]|nr:retrovirus-related Pol polyprotein from transposon 297 [Trichonephila clavipes]
MQWSECIEPSSVIKALCVESGEDWEGVLPLALFSLRTVAHGSTGFSLTELVMGKNLRTPQTLVYEEWMEEGNTSQSVVEYILQLNNRLKRCQDIAITRMKECQLKRKTWYDRDVVERKFVKGSVESPNKDPRPCVDYRRLNEITRAEFFPLPNMEEIVEKVSAAPYVTVMDLSKGYFQIPLTPRAQRYAAFVTPFGTYIPRK